MSAPHPISAYFDMLMSRWLDDEVVASGGKGQAKAVAPLKVRFSGRMVMLLGESTVTSVTYRVRIDGKLVEHKVRRGKEDVVLTEFDGADLAGRVKGNCHHAQIIAQGLDASRYHTLEIQPLLTGDARGELRIESICVAGREVRVVPASAE